MTVKVVDAVEGLAAREGQRLGRRNAHDEAADQSRADGDGDRVDVGEPHLGASECIVDCRAQKRDVLPACNLGDDPAELRVEAILIGRDVRQRALAVTHDRRRRIVARGLKSEDEHAVYLRSVRSNARGDGNRRSAVPKRTLRLRGRVERNG